MINMKVWYIVLMILGFLFLVSGRSEQDRLRDRELDDEATKEVIDIMAETYKDER